MKRIDRETVQRVIDTADIVEVVSDFVTLKRSGANYMGLCPFHNERTPSFSVSKAKGICKCFSCGKGGSPVNFIMELEQLSFQEAIRWLAKKYNIEIKEHEQSEEEQMAENERESLFAVNQFALEHFEKKLSETTEGQNVGKAYFTERGINDLMIKKFHLGYSLKQNNVFTKEALSAGFSEKYLLDSGLCGKRDGDNNLYDKYRERVIYPIFSISGRVLGFGGRILSKEKANAKYINSPENAIYHKSNELYGLFQAKKSIVKEDKCILVEGYMDVISMHQSGIENVVASSGTSLTEGQIRLIHRFTSNVTIIYDNDAAGIKASLRGIDLLLAEGLNVKVLLLPDGHDPDSFAQTHSSSQLIEYIHNNEVDFMRFKTDILLDGNDKDPIERSRVINDIVRSIAVIPDSITRAVYISECSRSMNIDEKTITLRVERIIRDNLINNKGQTKNNIENISGDNEFVQSTINQITNRDEDNLSFAEICRPYEIELLKYVIRLGVTFFCNADNEDGSVVPLTTLQYVNFVLESDEIQLTNSDISKTYTEILRIVEQEYPQDLSVEEKKAESERNIEIERNIQNLKDSITEIDLTQIQTKENEIKQRAGSNYEQTLNNFKLKYLINRLCSHYDDTIRNLATKLSNEKFTLSKYHTKYSKVESEYDQRVEIIQRAINELRTKIVEREIKLLNDELRSLDKQSSDAVLKTTEILSAIDEKNKLKTDLSKELGERIVLPKRILSK